MALGKYYSTVSHANADSCTECFSFDNSDSRRQRRIDISAFGAEPVGHTIALGNVRVSASQSGAEQVIARTTGRATVCN